MSFFLTPEERIRFASFLRNEERTSKQLIYQCLKLPGHVGKLMAQVEHEYSTACALIANKLELTETQEIKS